MHLFSDIISEHNTTKEFIYPVSVVIPTLGGESLQGTIEQLNRGTIVPKEILVCIPEEDAYKAETLLFPNVRVVKTVCRGQVAQRIEGFKVSSCDFVMQLDDDIIVDTHCIEYLIELLTFKNDNYAVSPSLRFIETGKSAYEPWSNKWKNKIYFSLINGKKGYQPGSITKAGTEIGIDPSITKELYYDVEWLLGGCVLHCKKNLILRNYYPHSGKAFCEDLYQSLCLQEMGIKMMVSSQAIAYYETPIKNIMSLKSWFKFLQGDYKARNYYVRVSSKSYFRMLMHYLFISLGYSIKSLTRL